ncbi:MAG: GatB/YqeY domain-containing protein [Candidatus Zixiibacteriota bacterium]
MSLLNKIDEDLIKSMKGGDKFKVTVLRGLKSDLKYKRIDKGDDLSEDDAIAVLSSAAKRRRDSIDQFQKGGRMDLVEQETAELKIIEEYLPEQLSEDKIKAFIAESIAETGANSPQQMGLVMKSLMPKLKGQADGKLVSKLVNQMLSNS